MYTPVIHCFSKIATCNVHSFSLIKIKIALFNERAMYQLIKLKGFYHNLHNHRNKYKKTFLWGVTLIGSERYNCQFKTKSGMGFEAIYRKAVAVDQRISKQQIRLLLANKNKSTYSMSKFSHIIFDAFISLLLEAIDRKGGLANCIHSLERNIQRNNNPNIHLKEDICLFKYIFISQLDTKINAIRMKALNPRNEELFSELERRFTTDVSGIYEGKIRIHQ